MKKYVVILVAIIAFFAIKIGSFAQTNFGNEWINYNNTYYKIQVAKDGMYRLTYQALLQAGVPINTINPHRLQMWHRGRQIAIYIKGQENLSDVTFAPDDYIDFYGQRNDGAMDTPMWWRPELQPHRYSALYNDSTAYFLTVNNSPQANRRIVRYTNFSNTIPLETHHIAERLVMYENEYHMGQSLAIEIVHRSEFDRGEGWTGTKLNRNLTTPYFFTIDQLTQITNQINPRLELLLVGRNRHTHRVQVTVGPNQNTQRLIGTAIFSGNVHHKFNATFAISDISSNGNLVIGLRVLGESGQPDAISVTYARVNYAQNFNAEQDNDRIYNIQAGTSQKRIQWSNTLQGVTVFDITRPHAVREIATQPAPNNGLIAVVDSTQINRKLFMTNGFAQIASAQISTVRFRQIDPALHNYLIVSHRGLMQPVGNIANPVTAFAAYRASLQGGGYDTLVVTFDQLVNQFNYGEKSPVAIRSFARYMLNGGNPKYLTIIGRGISLLYRKTRTQDNTSYVAYNEAINHIPPVGVPSSDVLHTWELKNPRQEAIPTGRINAYTPQELVNYLDKIIEYEQVPYDATWRKRAIHVTGGRTPSEIINFRQYVDEWGLIFKRPCVGGTVVNYGKTSSNIVEIINVAPAVNEGAGILSFLGHSSTFNTDVEMGSVSNDEYGYNNKGKYPFMLINGCYSGNLFLPNQRVFNEDWLFTKDRGAIGCIAHNDLALAPFLREHGARFYVTAFQDTNYYGKTVGELRQRISERLLFHQSVPSTFNQFTAVIRNTGIADSALVMQMVYHGDPAIRLFAAPKPDYKTANNMLFFKEPNLTVASDSFTIGIVVHNYGKASQCCTPKIDSLEVLVERTSAGGNNQIYPPQFFKAVMSNDTLYFKINNSNGASFAGQNTFTVKLDPFNKISELNEMNNEGVISYFFTQTGVIPLLPRPFSIVNFNQLKEGQLRFVAQATNLLAENRNYVIELDTTDKFNSPSRQTKTFLGGAIPEVLLPLISTSISHDSTVYYWRIRTEDGITSDSNWQYSSFVFIGNSPEGWYQGHFPQFKSTVQTGVSGNQNNRKWEFPLNDATLQVEVGGQQRPTFRNDLKVLFNGTRIDFGQDTRCGDREEPSFVCLALDKETLIPYTWNLGRVGEPATYEWQFKCGLLPRPFNYLNRINGYGIYRISGYINFIKPDDFVMITMLGHVPLVHALQDAPDLMNRLVQIGVDTAALRPRWQAGEPFIIFGRKGGAYGSAELVFGRPVEPQTPTNPNPNTTPPQQQVVVGNFVFSGQVTAGTILSPTIGPAVEWGAFFHQKEVQTNDEFKADIIGVAANGNEQIIAQDVPYAPHILSYVNANQYPYLRLKIRMKDDIDRTAPQLKKWIVVYKGVPEGVINPALTARENFFPTPKAEGEKFDIKVGFQNLTTINFSDSLGVQLRITNSNTGNTENWLKKYPILKANDTMFIQLKDINTIGKVGNNRLQIFVNPRLQPEEFYENNFIEIPFLVRADRANPVLDVAFDGVRIMDGDIVSPSPLISVVLKDENKHLIKKDTAGLVLLLKKPCSGCEFERISINNPEVRWTPAGSDNRFTIEYHPKNLADGKYTLRVQGTDVSTNKSGVLDYQINFEVVNKATITHFYPYPNPFSTATRFVFTLTGSEIPDQVKVQIMTVTGKVVREITQDELGDIRIGNNISSFVWDGTDEFGDRLANGVYLYRVLVRQNGQMIEHRTTAADNTFKHGFGKMYIMR